MPNDPYFQSLEFRSGITRQQYEQGARIKSGSVDPYGAISPATIVYPVKQEPQQGKPPVEGTPVKTVEKPPYALPPPPTGTVYNQPQQLTQPNTQNVLRPYVEKTPQRSGLTPQQAASEMFPTKGTTPQQVVAAIKSAQNAYVSEYNVRQNPQKAQSMVIAGAEASRQQELTYEPTFESVAFRTVGSVAAPFVMLPEDTPAGITREVEKTAAVPTAFMIIETGKTPIELLSTKGVFGIEKIASIVRPKIITTETTAGGKVGGVFGTLDEDVSIFKQASQVKVETTQPYNILGRTQTQTYDIVGTGTIRNLDKTQVGFLKDITVYDEGKKTILSRKAMIASKILKEETVGGTKFILSENQMALLEPISDGKYKLLSLQKTQSMTSIPQATVETETGISGTYTRLSAGDQTRSVTSGKSIFYNRPVVLASFEPETFNKDLLNIARSIKSDMTGESKIIKITEQGFETTTDVSTGGFRPYIGGTEQILSQVPKTKTVSTKGINMLAGLSLTKNIEKTIPKTTATTITETETKSKTTTIPITRAFSTTFQAQTETAMTIPAAITTQITIPKTETSQIQRLETTTMTSSIPVITVPSMMSPINITPSFPSGSGSWSGASARLPKLGLKMPKPKTTKSSKRIEPSILAKGVSKFFYGKSTAFPQAKSTYKRFAGMQAIGVPTKQTAGKGFGFSTKGFKLKLPKLKGLWR